eukprot:TRINITY_DN9576_c1_g1_i1.p1 TRINITY_DN9576_c1_g1~~TRINITY_DN9576_c1_g1_i1.p1  ORF type:complete len:215 (+),score=77.98 TRINITY_DN9576_c1_g1_i1:99-743(+)
MKAEDGDAQPSHKPSHGRRAQGERQGGGGGGGGGAEATSPTKEGGGKDDGAPTRQGGWDAGPTEEQREQQQKDEARKLEEATKHWGVDEVQGGDAAIPQLDGPTEQEAEAEDITRVVAEAPRNYNTAVQGPQELDREGLPHLPDTGHDVGVDTLILQQCISTVRDTEDEFWHPEQLFHDLAIQLQREKDERLEEAEEKVKEVTSPQTVLGTAGP